MKKLISMLVVLVMLAAVATSAFAFGFGEVQELVIGENTAEYAPYYDEEYQEYIPIPVMYIWTAEEDGTLTIDFSDEDEATVMCFIIYNNAESYDILEKGGQVSINVVAGATVTMEIYNEEAHIYESATFHFTASFEAGAEEVAGTMENPIVIDTMPVTLTGTFDDNADMYYKFVPATDGILDVADFSGCLIVVYVNGQETGTEMPATLVAGDEVVINLWYFGAGEYSATFSYEAAAAETVEHTFNSLVDVNIGSTEDKAEIPAGTTFADGFFTVIGKLTQRYQESKGGVYAVEIAKNLQGALEFTTAGTADVTIVVSSTGSSNTSAVALINVNTQEVMTNVEGLTEVSTTAATTLTYEDLPAGIYQLVSPESDYNRGFRLMTVNVVETVAASEEPACPHEYIYMEYDYCYEEYYLYDMVETCADCGETFERYVPGTKVNPMVIPFEMIQFNEDYSEARGTVTVPAGETIWFGIQNVRGMELYINGEFYGIMEPADPWDFWSPCAFVLTNDSDAEATYEFVLGWPMGSEYNPDQLPVNGSVDLYMPEDAYEYVYEWIATEDGELTLEIGGDYWTYRVNTVGDPDDWSSYIYGDTFYQTYGDSNTVTVSVKAGDTVTVFVGTLFIDGENWLYPETTLTITTTFTPAGGEGPCAHTNLVHFEAVEPGCHFNGNIEYWVCYDCECVWQDEALTQLTNIKNVVVPALGGEVIHVEAKAPTCYEEGNIEHWYCETCEQVWQDEALTQLTNHMNVKLGAAHTNLVHFEAVEPGCHFNGNIEYWVCYDCECVWQDEALTQVTNIKNIVVPALGGEVIHVEAKAPTCTENGNIEHWYCEKCEQVWQDEALTQLTNHRNVITPATGHTFVDGVCTSCGENDQNVPPTGDLIAIICAVAAVSSMGLIALPKKKEN